MPSSDRKLPTVSSYCMRCIWLLFPQGPGETSSYEVTTQLAAPLCHCSFPCGVLSGEKLLSNENSLGASLC